MTKTAKKQISRGSLRIQLAKLMDADDAVNARGGSDALGMDRRGVSQALRVGAEAGVWEECPYAAHTYRLTRDGRKWLRSLE